MIGKGVRDIKKIIKNKVYDTDTATLLGSHSLSLPAKEREDRWEKETLYRKITGEYFLHGEGGAKSKYRTLKGNVAYPGEFLIPVSYEQAKEWAEIFLKEELFNSSFGVLKESDEGDKTQQAVWLTPQAKRKLALMQSETGKSKSDIINDLIIDAK